MIKNFTISKLPLYPKNEYGDVLSFHAGQYIFDIFFYPISLWSGGIRFKNVDGYFRFGCPWFSIYIEKNYEN